MPARNKEEEFAGVWEGIKNENGSIVAQKIRALTLYCSSGSVTRCLISGVMIVTA